MEIIKRISLISLLLFLFLVPFNLTIANIGFLVFVLGIFVNKDLYKNLSLKTISNPVKYFIIISIGYWLWSFVSLLWSDGFDRGLQLCGRYVMLMAFPLSFYLAKVGVIIRNTKILAWIFLAGVVVSSFFCLIISFNNSLIETENGIIFKADTYYRDLDILESISSGYNNFAYESLSHFIHPSYYSFYFLFSILFLITELKSINGKKYKFLSIMGIIYSSFFIYLLQSRGNIIASIAVTLFFIVYYALINKKLNFLIIGFIFFISLTYFIIENSRLSWIIDNSITALKSDNKQEVTERLENTVNSRFIIWHNAFQVIKENPILGVGIGDTDTELEKQYQKNNVAFEFGTHNQYIYAQLSMGVIGLLLLLAMLFTPLYFGIKNRYFPLIGFAIAVMVNLMFENMLTRNAGLMFIPWATMLLLMMSEEKKNELAK
ncbi:MAG: O-antigen ligase family protein [Bacteroidales bacterium]|nr:O-antigen ligase family protein [Bacteroidales bacterium]